MKKKKFILPLSLLLVLIYLKINLGAQGDDSIYGDNSPQVVKPPIVSVQLYSNQAMVFRQSSILLEKGQNRFVIKDLSEKIIDDSVRISLKNSKLTKIQKIEVKTRHEKVFKSEKAKEAEARLNKAEARLKKLTDQYKVLKDEERFLKKISIAPVPRKFKDFKPQFNHNHWKATLDFIRKSMAKTHSSIQDLYFKIDEAREELTVAIAIADRNKSLKSLSKKEVHILLDSKYKDDTKLQLSYRITGAGWYPIYNARVLSQNGKKRSLRARGRNNRKARVRFISYALVKNETGEDWKSVELNFSAADPYESAVLPSLSSWIIKAVQRPVAKTRYQKKEYSSPKMSKKSRRPSKRRYEKAKKKDEYFSPSIARGSKVSGPGNDELQGYLYAQQSVKQSLNRSRSFYSNNQAIIQDKRAQRKSNIARKNIDGLQRNIRAQKRALKRGNYKEAMRRSDMILENINELSPRHRKFFAQEMQRANDIKKRSVALLETQKLVKRLVSPRQSSGGYDYRYSAKMPGTILSDGAFHKVFLFEKNLLVDLFYQTVPLKKSLAFLVGKVMYIGTSPLLRGPLSVFYNTDYIGEANIGNVASKEPFLLHLGSDESIQVSRRLSDFRVTSGLLSKSYTFRKTVDIEVKNRKKRTIVMEVFDRIPVSTDERVQITDIKISPAFLKSKKSGLYKFRLTLRPMEKQKITIEYKLSHPADVVPLFREKWFETW